MIRHLIEEVMTREGGYVDHPADRGGPTNMGITIATLSGFRGKIVTPADVKALPRDDAYNIYLKMYWSDPGFHTLDLCPSCIEMIFDLAVHSGPFRAIKLLQQAIGVHQDGAIGPNTREAAFMMPSLDLFHALVANRMVFLGKLITNDPEQAVFAHGWFRRLANLLTDYGV